MGLGSIPGDPLYGTQMKFILEMLQGFQDCLEKVVKMLLLLFFCSQSFTTCLQLLLFFAQENKKKEQEQQSLCRYSAGERGGSGVLVSGL